MPHGLDAADRKLLIGAGVLFLAMVVVSVMISPPQSGQESGFPSSYSPGWDGAEGTFLLLKDLGYGVTRWENAPDELPAQAEQQVLVLADPLVPPSEDDRFAISEFLQRGGRVVATGPSASQYLPEAKPFTPGDPFAGTEKFRALVPSSLVRGAPEIEMTPPQGWSPASLRQVEIYGNDQTVAVLTYRFGKGRVIWWGSSEPLTNGAIGKSGNLAFFLNCIGPPGMVHVFWDEYFHGMRGSLLTYLAGTPIFWGFGQLGLIFLAVIFSYSRRWGPVRPPAEQSRLSPLEFVDTLGDLYASAQVNAAAVDISYRRFRFVVTRKLGLPRDVPAAELAKSASESLGWDEAALTEVVNRCELATGSEDINPGQAMELVQQLHDYVERLEVGHSRRKERQTE